MSLEDYARATTNKVKNKIKQKLVPILLKYILPIIVVIFLMIILVGIIVGILGATTASASTSDDSQMADATVDQWEQFLRYVAIKEGGGTSGDYYVVEDDGAGNPTVGHGLCIRTGNSYLHVNEFAAYGIDSKKLKMGDKVSKEICDSIWGDHLKGLYNGIASSYSNLGLKEYQCYALTDVKYRRGNTNGFQDNYNSKWTDSDNQYGSYNESNEKFDTNTLYNFFWNGGHSLEGVNIRKKDQWVLFKYGYYRPLKEYWQANVGGETSGDYSVDNTAASIYGRFTRDDNKVFTIMSQTDMNNVHGLGTGWEGYCNKASAVIIASGYTNTDVYKMAKKAEGIEWIMSNESNTNKFFNEYGLKASVTTTSNTSKIVSTVKEVLPKGGCVSIRFNDYTKVDEDERVWTNSGHWIAILGYKNENGKEKMFIADPGHRGNQGWYSLDYFSKIKTLQYITTVLPK